MPSDPFTITHVDVAGVEPVRIPGTDLVITINDPRLDTPAVRDWLAACAEKLAPAARRYQDELEDAIAGRAIAILVEHGLVPDAQPAPSAHPGKTTGGPE